MCWSAQVSLNTWFLVLFAAVIGKTNKYFTTANTAFFLSFGSMQLVEYYLWTYLKNPSLNAAFSKIAYGLIMSQPFFSILQLPNPGNLLYAYAAFAVYGIYIAFNPKQFGIEMVTEVASNGHLLWKWLPTNILYLIPYFILLLLPFYLLGDKPAIIAAVSTLAISVYSYKTSGTWGSMWCWMCAMFSLWVLGSSISLNC